MLEKVIEKLEKVTGQTKLEKVVRESCGCGPRLAGGRPQHPAPVPHSTSTQCKQRRKLEKSKESYRKLQKVR